MVSGRQSVQQKSVVKLIGNQVPRRRLRLPRIIPLWMYEWVPSIQTDQTDKSQ